MTAIRLHFLNSGAVPPPRLSLCPDLRFPSGEGGTEYGTAVHDQGRLWFRVHEVGDFVVQSGFEEVWAFAREGVPRERVWDEFFRGIAPWVLHHHKWDCLHASSVLTAHGVVVLCGPSGRGKSTLARAWSETGSPHYADDAVLFTVREGRPLSARLPQSLRLREPALSHFGRHVDRPVTSDEDCFALDLEATMQPIAAVYWLQPMAGPDSERTVTIQRVRAAEAFPLLLSESRLMNWDACNRKTMENYLALAACAPVSRLVIRRDLDYLPSVIAALDDHCRPVSVR